MILLNQILTHRDTIFQDERKGKDKGKKKEPNTPSLKTFLDDILQKPDELAKTEKA